MFKFRFAKAVNTKLVGVRWKNVNHWAKLKKQTRVVDQALQHFDNFYAKMYGNQWKSIRLGLLSPNKYAAVVNIFADNEETEYQLLNLGTLDLQQYYERHRKKAEKIKLKRRLLEEKREAKKAERLAELIEKGAVSPDATVDDIEVSDVSDISDSELKGRGFTTTSEPEDLVEMFATDIESRKPEGFVNQAGPNIDLNDFVPSEEMKYQEEVLTDKPYYQFYEADFDLPVRFTTQERLEFPETLKVFIYPRSNISEFPSPTHSKGLNVTNFYLMDGASILPVLALDVKPKDVVVDLCAAPGGKALAIMLTLRPQLLWCNDSSASRYERLKLVFKTYVPELNNLKGIVNFTNETAERLQLTVEPDKILVDAPCTNDRHSVMEPDNNIFSTRRLKDRLELPPQQQRLLVKALKAVKPGGTVVYSTCSLSPIQNDGVVHMSLKQIWEETKLSFEVVLLKEAFRPLRGLFRQQQFKYGQQILPYVPSNCGPMYIAKLRRIE